MSTELERQICLVAQIKEVLNNNNATLLYVVLSGSDLYGFRSEDSDYDYRGAYILNTNRLLGLHKPKDMMEIKNGNDNDIVLFEIEKEINLALSGNCNVLEHLNAKPIHSTPDYLTLKPMLLTSWGKEGVYNAYKGMAQFNYKKFIASGRKNTVKKYLYVFRALSAGIYALEMKRVEPNLLVLNQHFKIPEIKQLIKIKTEGKEDIELPKSLDAGQIENRILSLFERLDRTYEKSDLPEKPSEDDFKKIEEWLIQLRKKHLT